MSEYRLTDHGRKICEDYLAELKAKRKEILDAGIDTIDETPNLPTVEEIFEDLVDFGFDEWGESFNSWYVTDHYDADSPVLLKLGRDIEEVST